MWLCDKAEHFRLCKPWIFMGSVQSWAVGSWQLWALIDTRGDRVPDPAAARGAPGLGLK